MRFTFGRRKRLVNRQERYSFKMLWVVSENSRGKEEIKSLFLAMFGKPRKAYPDTNHSQNTNFDLTPNTSKNTLKKKKKKKRMKKRRVRRNMQQYSLRSHFLRVEHARTALSTQLLSNPMPNNHPHLCLRQCGEERIQLSDY